MKKEITKEEALEWIAQMHMNKEEVREQIQEDIRTYLWDKLNKSNGPDFVGPCAVDDLCQIVVDNFKKLED